MILNDEGTIGQYEGVSDWKNFKEIKEYEPNQPTISAVITNRSKVTLMEGDTFTLMFITLPTDIADKTVTWSSSDESVATVTDGSWCLCSRYNKYLSVK